MLGVASSWEASRLARRAHSASVRTVDLHPPHPSNPPGRAADFDGHRPAVACVEDRAVTPGQAFAQTMAGPGGGRKFAVGDNDDAGPDGVEQRSEEHTS